MQQGRSQSAAAPSSEGSVDCNQWFGTVFTNDKAGMGAVDKEKVKKVVYEMSKDSAHFRNDLRKQSQTERRIKGMKEKASTLSAAEIAGHARAMDMKLAGLKASADLTRQWLVVDLDAFFASVEELDDPSLKTKPMAVGGIGMISTANYVARKFGIRSAMPGFIGRRLCPQLVFVKPDFSKYVRVAAATRAIFVDYDPDFEAGSLDEAYLDVTDYCQMHSTTGEAVAETIRRRVREEVHVTCSCGIGPNRLLAKVASDMRKPDGQYAIPPDHTAITRFIDALPIRKVPGIGKVSEQVLKAFSIETCAGLIANRGLLAALFSPVSVNFFMAAALGIGRTQHGEPVEEGAIGRKGISNERTFQAMSAPTELEAKCAELSEKLAEDMASEGLQGKTLTLKLKETNFEVRTRNITLTRHISSREDILREALKLLRAEMPITIRLMGIRMSGFLKTNTGPGQRTLAAFLKKDGSDSAARPVPPQQHGWNQTFLGRETREALAKQFQEHRLKQDAEFQASNPTSRMDGMETASTSQEALRDAVRAGTASSGQTEQAKKATPVSEAGHAEEPPVHSHTALEPSQAPEAASQQPLELTLRDWQPSTASQLAKSESVPSQHLQRAEQSQHSSQSSLRLAPHQRGQSTLARESRHQQPEQDVGSTDDEVAAVNKYGGDLSTCRDVLDTADEAGGPDLVHAWEEEPAGIGDGPEDGSQSASQSAAAKAMTDSRMWTCQVCTFDDNRHQILRCAICDAVRGTSLDYFMGHNAEVSSGTQQDPQDSVTKSGSRSRRAGSEAAGNKQKSILGFFAGSDAGSRGTDADKVAAGSPASVRQIDAPACEEQPCCRSEPAQTAAPTSQGDLWQKAGGGMWLCKQCSGQVPENEKVTHEDFHLAMQLSRAQSGVTIGKPWQGNAGAAQMQKKRKLGSGGRSNGSTKRSPKTVASFLKPPNV